jgi:hypothetical protein
MREERRGREGAESERRGKGRGERGREKEKRSVGESELKENGEVPGRGK